LTELELRFAESPQSDAFIPLCEAYLAQGRTMEAMVVCKKGLKAAPDRLEGQLLLVRILMAQKKLTRARAEIDRVVQMHETRAEPYFARARLELDMGEVEAALADLRATLDRNPRHEGAHALLAEHAPSAAPSSAAPGPIIGAPVATSGAPYAPPPGPQSTPGAAGPAPAPSAAETPPAAPPPAGGPSTPFATPPSPAAAPPSAFAPQGRALPPAGEGPRRRLEGEDELEALASRVAEERPKGGRLWVTVVLAGVLLVAGAGFVAWRVIEKGRVEAIDQNLHAADEALEDDKYRSYQKAAVALTDIIEDYDRDHPGALSRLAHTYAILWGEHGELDLEPQLRAVLDQADAHAPDAGRTAAAQGLHRLYDATDRGSGARAALEVLQPHVAARRAKSAPPDAAFVTLGIALIAEGEYEAALRILDEARSYLTSSVRAKVWAARAARRAGNLSEARAAFEEALRLEPAHPGALIGLVQVHLERGRLAKAAEDLVRFDELRNRAPKDISQKDMALAWFVRSQLARSAGEEAEAAAAYQTAVQMDPGNPDFPFGLGRWLLEAERPEEALEYLQRAASLEPERYGILVELAEAEMVSKDFDDAAEHIDQALAANPSFVPAKLARARLMRRTDRNGTEAYLMKLLEEHPTARIDVKLELGRLYRDRREFDDAKQVLEAAIEGMGSAPKPKQADVFLAYGRLMDEAGQTGTAENAYEKAGELGELEAWYRLASLGRRAGDLEAAAKGCKRYLQAGTNLRYSDEARELCGVR
jgi:tetratricopeptide (TPR) repeat protein